jgi:hypothetical protein
MLQQMTDTPKHTVRTGQETLRPASPRMDDNDDDNDGKDMEDDDDFMTGQHGNESNNDMTLFEFKRWM